LPREFHIRNLTVVIHRRYRGQDRDAKGLKEVVVKQSVAVDSQGISHTGLSREARSLEYFKDSGSPHIIKMYRRLYEEPGNNSMSLDEGTVHRLFMEYCPGGDLHDWLEKKLIG
jgi:hypothetical protein